MTHPIKYCLCWERYFKLVSINSRVVMSENPIPWVFVFVGGFLHIKIQGEFLLFFVFLA